MSRGSGNPGRDGLRRRAPKYTGDRILVVTEGSKTEPKYFESLKRKLKLHSLTLEVVHPDATDPISIVKYASDRLRISAREVNKADALPAFDYAWVVIDREAVHHERMAQLRAARDLVKGAKIHFALSNPCFEFWILLHFVKTTSSSADCPAVLREVKRHLPGYNKGSDCFHLTCDRLPEAFRNAQFCRDHHAASGGSGNPSTDIDQLVRMINDAASPAQRMNLGPSTDSRTVLHEHKNHPRPPSSQKKIGKK